MTFVRNNLYWCSSIRLPVLWYGNVYTRDNDFVDVIPICCCSSCTGYFSNKGETFRKEMCRSSSSSSGGSSGNSSSSSSTSYKRSIESSNNDVGISHDDLLSDWITIACRRGDLKPLGLAVLIEQEKLWMTKNRRSSRTGLITNNIGKSVAHIDVAEIEADHLKEGKQTSPNGNDDKSSERMDDETSAIPVVGPIEMSLSPNFSNDNTTTPDTSSGSFSSDLGMHHTFSFASALVDFAEWDDHARDSYYWGETLLSLFGVRKEVTQSSIVEDDKLDGDSPGNLLCQLVHFFRLHIYLS